MCQRGTDNQSSTCQEQDNNSLSVPCLVMNCGLSQILQVCTPIKKYSNIHVGAPHYNLRCSYI